MFYEDNQQDEQIQLYNLILNFIAKEDFTSLENLLNSPQKVDITQLYDEKKFTLIHKVVLQDSYQFLNYFLKYAESVLLMQETQIQHWINIFNQEGLSAIHYASYKGNIQIIETLVKYKCDVTIKSSTGQNVLHLAAQENKPESLCYFHNLGLNLEEVDISLGSALHWACYMGNENCVNYLVAKFNDINKPDKEQLTPLHLAVISGNSRVVKKLLLRGADRNAKNKEGNNAAQLAKQNEYFNIEQMIKSKKGLAEYLLVILYISSLFIFSYFSIPCYNFTSFNVEYALLLFLSISTVVFMLLAWLTNPGFVNNQQKKRASINNNTTNSYSAVASHFASDKLLNLYQKCKNQTQICADCEIIKPQRSKHCEICRKCVKVYDHHCPWINNCVGANNIKYFVLFVIFMWLDISLVIFETTR